MQMTECLRVPAAACALTLAVCAASVAAPDPNTNDAAAARLAEQARAAAAAQLARLGEGYEVRFDSARRLVFVSALDEEHFRQTARLVAKFSDAIRKTLDLSPPTSLVTVVLPTAEDYAELRPGEEVTGFYTPADRTLISLDRGRVLVHEFTHALHHADAAAARQQHRVWVWEGLATLCDASNITPGGVLDPQVDVRVVALQKAIRRAQTIPLEKLVDLTPGEFHARAELCYAEARYLMLYLHERDKLPAFYAAYKGGFEDDPTGRIALEDVLGRRLGDIEDDWETWALELEMPWGELRSGEARLGLGLQDTPQGAKVVSLAPGSAAERAGRIHVGDIVLAFNGVPTSCAAEVVGAVQACGANQTVNVELRRRGRQITIQQPLGAPRQR